MQEASLSQRSALRYDVLNRGGSGDQYASACGTAGERDSRAQRRAYGSIRVLHLINSGGLYGAEQVILNLARSQHVASVVGALHNAHRPNLELIEEARKRGLETAVFDSRGRVDLTTIFQIKKFLQTNAIDILHTHNYKSDIIGCAAALLAGTKWIATNHVWHPVTGRLRLYEGADAFVLRFARLVVAVSSGVKQDLIDASVPTTNIRVIVNGIDLDRFAQSKSKGARLRAILGVDERDVVVTIVGRLSPEKGHATFLKAASGIEAKRNNVRFLIVGDGPMAGELRQQAAEFDLSQHVIFTGFRTDMPEVYAASDVLVSASSIEGLPMTLLEAMASQVPVIATRIGGIPEVITDEETGLLVNPNDVDGLRVKMLSLIDNPLKRRQLAAAALEFVRINHTFQHMCDHYVQIYQEIVSGQ